MDEIDGEKVNRTDPLSEVVTKGGSEVETYALYPRFFNVVLEHRPNTTNPATEISGQFSFGWSSDK